MLDTIKTIADIQSLDRELSGIFWNAYKEIAPKAEGFYSEPILAPGKTALDYHGDTYTVWTGGGVTGTPDVTHSTVSDEVIQVYEQPLQATMLTGFSKTIGFRTYRKQLVFKKEDFDDAKWQEVFGGPKQLGILFKRHLNLERLRLFVYGHSTTDDRGSNIALPDTTAIFATQHYYKNAKNVSTLGSTGFCNYATGGASALSDTSLNTALKAMQAFRDNSNEIIQVEPDALIVPRALERTAVEILGSTNKPFEMSNTVNFWKERSGQGINIIVWDDLDKYSTTQWYLVDTKLLKSTRGLIYFPREDLSFASETPADTAGALKRLYTYVATIRYGITATDWRWGYKSAGV